MEIIPTVLEQNIEAVEARLSQIKSLSSWFQVDVIDGHLSSGQSFPLELLNRLDPPLDKHLFDVHLMVKEPQSWIKKCIFVQASRIYGQVEAMSDREAFVSEVKNNGLEVGLAFDLDTPVDPQIPPETDYILLMSRPLGFGELPFDLKVLPKIDYFHDRGYKVAVDGGVTPSLLPTLTSHQVDIIYSGHSYLDLIHEKTN